MNATPSLEDWDGWHKDNVPTRIDGAENVCGHLIVIVAKCTKKNPAIDNIVVDVGVVDISFVVADGLRRWYWDGQKTLLLQLTLNKLADFIVGVFDVALIVVKHTGFVNKTRNHVNMAASTKLQIICKVMKRLMLKEKSCKETGMRSPRVSPLVNQTALCVPSKRCISFSTSAFDRCLLRPSPSCTVSVSMTMYSSIKCASATATK